MPIIAESGPVIETSTSGLPITEQTIFENSTSGLPPITKAKYLDRLAKSHEWLKDYFKPRDNE